MATKKLRVGLDFHGVITKFPKIFKQLSVKLLKSGCEVYIITGHPDDSIFRSKLKDLVGNVKFTKVFSITDYLLSFKHAYTIDSHGGKIFDYAVWNSAKATYCKKHKIDLMIDDSEEYGRWFETPYLQLRDDNEKGVSRR